MSNNCEERQMSIIMKHNQNEYDKLLGCKTEVLISLIKESKLASSKLPAGAGMDALASQKIIYASDILEKRGIFLE